MVLVEQPGLSRLFAGCPDGLERRRAEFEAVWADVISPATGKR